jgi:hypothetical protein
MINFMNANPHWRKRGEIYIYSFKKISPYAPFRVLGVEVMPHEELFFIVALVALCRRERGRAMVKGREGQGSGISQRCITVQMEGMHLFPTRYKYEKDIFNE